MTKKTVLQENALEMEGFELGRPSLVCRWRLADRALPLENRHLRALSRRMLGGAPVSPQLVAWAKQHIEWTLSAGALEHPDGVLMVIVDGKGRAAMTVGPYEPLKTRTVSLLADRAAAAGVLRGQGTGPAGRERRPYCHKRRTEGDHGIYQQVLPLCF